MLTCSACRSPVDVPADYAAATIRCGICWAEITLDPPPVAEVIAPVEEPAPAAKKSDPFRGIPGRTAKGMAPLEALLRKLAERVPSLFVPAAVPIIELKTPPPVMARRPKPRRTDDDDLRRKRGTASQLNSKIKDEIAPPPRLFSKLMLILLIVLFMLVFVIAYEFLR